MLADPIPAIREWLMSDPAIAAMAIGGVVHRTPEPLVLPLVRITRIGGGGHRFGLQGWDSIRLQVDTFADWQNEPQAMALHNLVRNRLLALCEASFSFGGVQLGCPQENSGPSQTWDESRTAPAAWVRSDWAVRAWSDQT